MRLAGLRSSRNFLPWRSATIGWAVTLLALLVGAPLFLCMPPWVDVTLYDMCVRSILDGGVYYRDVFDTNLPGIAWAMTGVRALFGWSYEALRAADLAVMAAEVALLCGWIRRAGSTHAAIAWFAAAVTLFYPFTSEFVHVQRDGWMLLPALLAARLRLARMERGHACGRERAGFAILEGIAWGAAVWVKPHVIIPAGCVWIASAVVIARREPLRRVLADLGGVVLGGLLAGTVGIVWLVQTGAWPYFRDVFVNWNPNYLSGVLGTAGVRFIESFTIFRPWGMLYYVSLPLAFVALWEARIFSRHIFSQSMGEPKKVPLNSRWYSPASSESIANARGLLAALYLGWTAQAIFLQKGLDYVQVPVMLLAMAMIATQRWAFGFVYLVWFAILGIVLNFTNLIPPERAPGIPVLRLEQYPLTDPQVLSQWSRCWREGSTPELRNRLGHYVSIHCGTNWEQLANVAAYLRTVQPPLGPGELNCWHDSTHSLYLQLNLAPATRYMHYGTVFAIPSEDNWIRKRVAEDVAASPQRYVVADLTRMTWHPDLAQHLGPGGDPNTLPDWFPLSQRTKFPWNQELVFRSGRYVVYRVSQPLGEIDIPDWETLEDLGPGKSPPPRPGPIWPFEPTP